jgi:hypothetical protein
LSPSNTKTWKMRPASERRSFSNDPAAIDTEKQTTKGQLSGWDGARTLAARINDEATNQSAVDVLVLIHGKRNQLELQKKPAPWTWATRRKTWIGEARQTATFLQRKPAKRAAGGGGSRTRGHSVDPEEKTRATASGSGWKTTGRPECKMRTESSHGGADAQGSDDFNVEEMVVGEQL